MTSLRNLVLVGAVAIAGALSIGTANATPVPAVSIPAATDSAVTPVHHYGYYNYDLRYCYLSFYQMVERFGFGNARDLKRACHRRGL